MKKLILLIFVVGMLVIPAAAKPPFDSIVDVTSDVINEDDESSYSHLKVNGLESSTAFDREKQEGVAFRAHSFDATFKDTRRTIKIYVATKYSASKAAEIAERLAIIMGKTPIVLRAGLSRFIFDIGPSFIGDGVASLDIDDAREIDDDTAEEVIMGVLIVMTKDSLYATDPTWAKAQRADGEFISTIANNDPEEMDFVHSLIAYLAIKCRPERLSAGTKKTIERTIPNRIAFFDTIDLALSPFEKQEGAYFPLRGMRYRTAAE